MFKNVVKSVASCGLLIVLFCFPIAYAYSSICEFDGWMTSNSTLWKELEFNVLLEGKETPGYLLMTRTIGRIFVTDKEILKTRACKVHQYVQELIKFYDAYKEAIGEKDPEVANMLAFIKNKLEIGK